MELRNVFENDPTAIVAAIVKEMYPNIHYRAQIVPELKDENGEEVYGETLFPDDGGVPLISISAQLPLIAVAEIFTHEIAHVVAGIGEEHGTAWEEAQSAIFERYNQVLDELDI